MRFGDDRRQLSPFMCLRPHPRQALADRVSDRVFGSQRISLSDKSLAPYRQCSAVRIWLRMILERACDSAICTNPLAQEVMPQ
jgi:hypothetical protein